MRTYLLKNSHLLYVGIYIIYSYKYLKYLNFFNLINCNDVCQSVCTFQDDEVRSYKNDSSSVSQLLPTYLTILIKNFNWLYADDRVLVSGHLSIHNKRGLYYAIFADA